MQNCTTPLVTVHCSHTLLLGGRKIWRIQTEAWKCLRHLHQVSGEENNPYSLSSPVATDQISSQVQQNQMEWKDAGTSEDTQLPQQPSTSSPSLPSYMLTPVSSFGTPTITLEVDPVQVYPPPEELKQSDMPPPSSENPLPQLELVAGKLSSAIRITKLDQPTSAPPTLLQVVDSSSSAPSAPKNPQVLLAPYSNLLTGAGGMSPQTSALHLALLAQSQQMRSLGLASIPTTSVSTSQAASSTSAISTVVASPLPPSLSTPQAPPSLPPAKRDHSSPLSATKREQASSSSSSPSSSSVAKRDHSSSSSKRVRALRRATSSGD